MRESFHDPREFAKVLQQILASDTKRIGFLTGAGSSMAATKIVGGKPNSLIPGVAAMTEIILSKIVDNDLKLAINEIEEELKDVGQPFMLENILSWIIMKIQVIGKGELCKLDRQKLKDLRDIFKTGVKELIEVHKDPSLDKENLLHTKFARWIKNISRKTPIEIFTTNYDYLFEIGFEKINLPYFDGFVGSFSPFFDSNSVEYDELMPRWTKLWKLHGSLGWEYDKENKKIIRSRDKDQDGIMVYPTLLKYDDSRKHPYISYMDRLASFIRKEDGIIFISGYSFGDEHINNTIVNALHQSRSSHAIAFVFDKNLNEDSPAVKLAKQTNRLTIFSNRVAVRGGKFGKWKLFSEPTKDESIQIDSYFDEDAAEIIDIGGTSKEIWTGEGECTLVDFKKFVDFLLTFCYSIK